MLPGESSATARRGAAKPAKWKSMGVRARGRQRGAEESRQAVEEKEGGSERRRWKERERPAR